jgi:hypothetical protein
MLLIPRVVPSAFRTMPFLAHIHKSLSSYEYFLWQNAVAPGSGRTLGNLVRRRDCGGGDPATLGLDSRSAAVRASVSSRDLVQDDPLQVRKRFGALR